MTTVQQVAAWALRRHIGRRHPRQTWYTRLLLRRMDLHSLVIVHLSEHQTIGSKLGHAVDDFSDTASSDS